MLDEERLREISNTSLPQPPSSQPSGLIDLSSRDLIGDTSSISSSQIDDFLVAHGILSPSDAGGKESPYSSPSPTRGRGDKGTPDHHHDDEAKASSRYRQDMVVDDKEALSTPPGRRGLASRSPNESTISSFGMGSPSPGGGGGGVGSRASWEGLNRLLRQEGFRGIGSGGEGDPSDDPDPDHLAHVLKQVLHDYRERGELIRAYQLERARLNSDHNLVTSRLSGAEKTTDTLNDSLASANVRIKDLEEEIETKQKKLSEQSKEFKVKLSNLTTQLRHSEHRVQQKEKQLEQMMAKFDNLVAKEQKEKEKERQAIRKLQQQREFRGQGGHSQARLLEVISSLETDRERRQDEVQALREELKSLNDLVKEKENYISRKEMGGAWRSSGGAGALDRDGMAHMVEKIRELERVNRGLRLKEEGLAKKVEALEEQALGWKDKAKRLEEDNVNLTLELKSRPTVRAWRGSQKRIEELEIKLHKAVEEAREASDLRELRKHMGVGELIKRDKANYRLKLDRLDALPREVMKEVLKEVCRLLDVGDVADVAPTVEKMARVMHTIPRMERFVKETCGYVVRKVKGEYHEDGRPITTEEIFKRYTMEEVLEIIKGWWEALEGMKQLRRFRSGVIQRLSARAGTSEAQQGGVEQQLSLLTSDEALLDALVELVELEKKVTQSTKVHEEVDKYLQTKPELFLNRVVQHFQYLFSVKKPDGLFPKMNELYLFVSEMENFTRVLKAMLGLDPKASTNTLLVKVQSAIRRGVGGEASSFSADQVAKGHGLAGDDDEDPLDEEEEEEKNYVVEKEAR